MRKAHVEFLEDLHGPAHIISRFITGASVDNLAQQTSWSPAEIGPPHRRPAPNSARDASADPAVSAGCGDVGPDSNQRRVRKSTGHIVSRRDASIPVITNYAAKKPISTDVPGRAGPDPEFLIGAGYGSRCPIAAKALPRVSVHAPTRATMNGPLAFMMLRPSTSGTVCRQLCQGSSAAPLVYASNGGVERTH